MPRDHQKTSLFKKKNPALFLKPRESFQKRYDAALVMAVELNRFLTTPGRYDSDVMDGFITAAEQMRDLRIHAYNYMIPQANTVNVCIGPNQAQKLMYPFLTADNTVVDPNTGFSPEWKALVDTFDYAEVSTFRYTTHEGPGTGLRLVFKPANE